MPDLSHISQERFARMQQHSRGRLAHDKDDEIVLYMYVLIMLAERSNCNANWHHPDENKVLNRTKLSLTASPLCASLESSYQVWTSSELRIRVVDHPIRLSFHSVIGLN